MKFIAENKRLLEDLQQAAKSDPYFDKSNAKIIAEDYCLTVPLVLKQIQQLRKEGN